MGALLAFFGMAGAAPAMMLRFKALLIGAVVMAAVCLALTAWALIERSGRLLCRVDVVRLEAQNTILADAVKRQNDGIEATRTAGKAAQDGVRQLIEAAGKLSAAGTRLRSTMEEARRIASAPAPKRPDGRDRDCTDAWREIEGRTKP